MRSPTSFAIDRNKKRRYIVRIALYSYRTFLGERPNTARTVQVFLDAYAPASGPVVPARVTPAVRSTGVPAFY